MAKHVWITGGAGFIGSHVVDRLVAEGGWNITILDNFDPFYPRALKEANIREALTHSNVRLVEGDLLDENITQRMLEASGRTPDLILHMAAKAGVRPSILDPIAYHQVNVTGTLRLLEAARELKVPHFILASSSSVYGEDPNVPWKERDRGLQPISPYAATKIAAEQFAQVYTRLHGMRITVLRFFTVYGPRQRPDLAIHKFFRNIGRSEAIPQYGDGGTRRDYTFVDDIVAGVRAAMDRNTGELFEIYNLGNSDTIRLRDLILAIEETLGMKAIIDQRPEQPGDVPQTYADVSKAAKDLGFRPATPLKEGLHAFHSWYQEVAQPSV